MAVHAAIVQDRFSSKPLLGALDEKRCPRLQTFINAGCQGRLEQWTAEELGFMLQIVPTIAGQTTFMVLPKR